MAERPKARVCGLSVAAIAGSNPVGDINVSCVCCVFCQVEVSVTGRFLVQRSPADCGVSLRVI